MTERDGSPLDLVQRLRGDVRGLIESLLPLQTKLWREMLPLERSALLSMFDAFTTELIVKVAMTLGAAELAKALYSGAAERPFPEGVKTLLLQQQALMERRRPCQMFPTETAELPLPPGMNRLATPRGVFHYDPGLIDAEAIQTKSRDGRQYLSLIPHYRLESAQTKATSHGSPELW